MKNISCAILLIVCYIVFTASAAQSFPDTCIPGTCNGDLRDSNDVKKGTFSDWYARADTTTGGNWSYTAPAGTVESNDANGTYTYNVSVPSSSATYTGTASFPSHPEYETSTYTMELSLIFPGPGYCEGDWSIDFDEPTWPDMSGTWHHTGRYFSPMASHANHIFIESGINYDEPDETEISYEFDFEIETDDTVELVRVTTPGTPGVASGITFDIPKLADQWDDVNQVWTTYEYDPCEDIYCWEYSKDAVAPSGLDSYGDGWYGVTVFYDGGGSDSTEIWFSVPADTIPIPQPTQRPLFTNVTNRQRLDSPVTLQWQPCTDPNVAAIWMGFGKMLDGEEIEIPLSKTDTSYGPVDVNDGYWEVDILFDHWYDVARNADGISYGLAKYSESDYMFGFGILAELTGDDIVNFRDFAEFAQGWLDYDCYEFNNFCDRADLNFDEHVDYDDLQIMCEDWLAQP